MGVLFFCPALQLPKGQSVKSCIWEILQQFVLCCIASDTQTQWPQDRLSVCNLILLFLWSYSPPHYNLIGEVMICPWRMQETLNRPFMAHATSSSMLSKYTGQIAAYRLREVKGSNSLLILQLSFSAKSCNAKSRLVVQKVNCMHVIHALLMAKLEPIFVSCWVFLIQRYRVLV